MCGIAGIINPSLGCADFEALKNMTNVQRHRGPDDQGFAAFSIPGKKIIPVDPRSGIEPGDRFSGAIGFNRLSILDLSVNGHQPMISQNGRVVIAYNGETYNAFQFKNDLEQKGYVFRGKSDTEVLLNLYQELGIVKMLELVNGMFAFCIADMQSGKVYLARDHVGIKPMYWCRKDTTVLFASEIKAFLFHPDFRAEIDENHVDEYLYYKFCAYNRTLFKDVFQVPPGHYLEISSGEISMHKYWEPRQNITAVPSRKEALEKLEQTLKESVRNQLISDVKVGCQLSGGIDSTLVTTFARRYFNADMDTFSIILSNEKFSEERYIDQVIAKTNPAAHKFILTPEVFFQHLISAAWHMDVPLPIPQSVAIKRLAEGSAEHVTVLLSGEGSDELMGGYHQFYYQAFRLKNRLTLKLLSAIPGKGKKIERQYLPYVDDKEYFVRFRSAVHYDEFIAFRPESELVNIFKQRRLLFPGNGDLLFGTRVYDMRSWLVNLLNIQDKMTMAHSIENRVPILDKQMIDRVFSLPSEYFVHGSRNPLEYNSPNRYTKILLKKVAEKYYHREFAFRTKMGFNQPLHDYFAHPQMKEFTEDVILPGIKKRGILDHTQLLGIWKNLNHRIDAPGLFLFWTCFTFELWAMIFIDRKLGPWKNGYEYKRK